jgi:hypothetical protein
VQTAESSLDGLWLTDGYGQLLEFKKSTLLTYEITDVSCILAGKATRQAGSQPGEMVFADRSREALRITPGISADKRWLHVDGSVANIELHRAPSRPEACDHKTANTPQKNYEIFWQSFSEQYPFFALRQLDWAAVDKQFRPQVTGATSQAQLFSILKQMIEPLHDAHTGIDAKSIHSGFGGYRANSAPLQSKHIGRIRKVIQKKYLRRGLRDYCKHQLHYGLLSDSIGYLRIDGFSKYCEAALDDIFKDSSKLTGLVIDERITPGGSDVFGISIASRLANHEYLAYSKVIRNDIHDADHRTAPQPSMVSVSSRPGFHGPVVLLIGPDSHSAAETFAMAVLDRKPHITRVGDNTQGVFSDVLDRTLPNGWHFYLPNEVFLTKDGKAFDGLGVPPDLRVPVFSEEDLRNGRDSALDKAIELLGQAPRQ